MEARRKRNHVRTGCTTCKRRRVKCSEEKPHCRRCILGGFTCAGYDIPKAWIFQNTYNADKDVKHPGVGNVTKPAIVESGSGLSSQSKSGRSDCPSPASLVQLGNSDPFRVYPVHLGPHETSLLRIRPSEVLSYPCIVSYGYPEWTYVYKMDSSTHIAECLENQLTGFGLLAHNAALQSMLLKGHRAAITPSVLFYIIRAQACLRRALSIVSMRQASARSLHDLVLTSGFLAGAESCLGLPNVDMHVRSIGNIMVRQIEALACHWRPVNFIAIMQLGVIRAILSFERSLLDTTVLLPRLCEDLWVVASGSSYATRSNLSGYSPHKSVEDAKTRHIMLNRMLQLEAYISALRNNHNQQGRLFLHHAVEMEDYLHHAQLLDVALDAEEILKNSTMSRLNAQSQHAKVYIAIAIQLWMRNASPTNFTNNLIYDTAPSLLPRLKKTLAESIVDGRDRAIHEKAYAPARLWTLYIGLQTEFQRIDRQHLKPICHTWFLEAFQSQVSGMQIETWQEAVVVLKQFLFFDYVEPHISGWWSSLPLR